MTGDELGSYGTKATPQSTKPQLLPQTLKMTIGCAAFWASEICGSESLLRLLCRLFRNDTNEGKEVLIAHYRLSFIMLKCSFS